MNISHNRRFTVVAFTAHLVFICVLYAQAPDTLWTKAFGGASDDIGYGIQQLSDGGYIIVGYTESFGLGGGDIWLIRTNVAGDTLWTQTYGAGDGTDIGWSVQQTIDGGFIAGGTIYRSFIYQEDAYLIKTDSLGDSLWAHVHGGNSPDLCYTAIETRDSGYAFVAMTMTADWQMKLTKLDRNGDMQWIQGYGTGSGYSLKQMMDGGYIVAGTKYGDVLLVKADSSGDSLWTHTYGGSWFDVGHSVVQTSDGGYIVVGHTASFGVENGAFYVVKTDSIGDTLWTRYFDGPAPEWAHAVHETDDGNYVIVGWTDSFGGGSGSNIYLMKINSLGDTLWTQTYGGDSSDHGFDMDLTSDGGYILVGDTKSFGSGGRDVYLVKTAPDVSVQEERTVVSDTTYATSIICGPLLLPGGKHCRVFDITGRIVTPDKIRPGIYFIEIDGKITQKVVKIR